MCGDESLRLSSARGENLNDVVQRGAPGWKADAEAVVELPIREHRVAWTPGGRWIVLGGKGRELRGFT